MLKTEYSRLEKLFHRLSVGSISIAEITFEINLQLFKKKVTKIDSQNNSPVFISGLARSGSTAIMNALYQTNQFTSLTYSDMPFVLAPNIWSKFKSKKASSLIERSHADGVYINNHSPEALDEVFWKVLLENKHVINDRLLQINISNSVLKKFELYIQLILLNQNDQNKQRYLSKNNNNILRLQYLKELFPNSKIIVPYRSPVEHAESLLNQHLHFCKKQKADPFILNYMNWIGHYEFGLNQKPFYLDDEEIFNELKNHSPLSINYWLLIWLNYYKFILSHTLINDFFLVDYQSLLSNPSETINQLFEKLSISENQLDFDEFKKKKKDSTLLENLDPYIVHKCDEVYSSLQKIASNI